MQPTPEQIALWAAVDAERLRCANIVQECREDGETDHRTIVARILDKGFVPNPDHPVTPREVATLGGSS